MPQQTPPIPPITDPELFEAVSSVVRAADSYRKVLFTVCGQIGDEAVSAMLKHEDLLSVCDRVIDAWRTQLGHDDEDAGRNPS